MKLHYNNDITLNELIAEFRHMPGFEGFKRIIPLGKVGIIIQW